MLTRTHISSLARPAVLFGIAAMIALPAQASAPGSQYVSAPIVQEIEPDVASAFTRFDALPDSPEPSGNVVDIDTIEPPIEIVEPVAPIPPAGVRWAAALHPITANGFTAAAPPMASGST